MDRISNSFVNSLRSDKTPNKNSVKSKYNTPSPYPQRTPNANSSNNTKKRTTVQVETQSSKAGKQTNRTSLNNISLIKSLSPQPIKAQMQSKSRERISQVISDSKSGAGNDYMKMFNMEKAVSATSQQNQNQFYQHEAIIDDISKTNQQQPQNNQYFTEKTTNNIMDYGTSQNRSNINTEKSNRQIMSNQNNLFAQVYSEEKNSFFRTDNNNQQDQSQKQNIQQIQPQNFFRTNYQQEKLFQGGQKNSITSKKEDQNNIINQQNVQINQNSAYFQSNNNNNNQIASLQSNIQSFDEQTNHQKNISNIFALKQNNSNNTTSFSNNNNCITGALQTEINQKNQFKQDDIIKQQPIIQRDISQTCASSNLKDLRLLHKQQKQEKGEKLKSVEKNEQSNEKSLSFQKNVLDIIKGINDKMKFNSKKVPQQGPKVDDTHEQLIKEIQINSIIQNQDIDNSLAAPTIISNDSNKTFEDSLIYKHRQVENKENEQNINQIPNQNKFFSKNNVQIGNNNNKLQEQIFQSKNNQISTKLEQIKEINISKNAQESNNSLQYDEDSHQYNQMKQDDQMNDLLATRKNLFGNYSQKDSNNDNDDLFSHIQENKETHFQSQNTIRSNNFMQDESISYQNRSQNLNSKTINKQQQDTSSLNNYGDRNYQMKQNITNSILDKAFLGDITDIKSNDKNEIKGLQGNKNYERMITSLTSDSQNDNINQDTNGFQDGINFPKSLDQKMGIQDISPIQSQNIGKSSGSASKKDNSQLIHELQNMYQPMNYNLNFYDSNSFGMQIFNSLSFDQGKNSTSDISTKKQDNIKILQNENICTPFYKDSNKQKICKLYSQEKDQSFLKYEEQQTPIIQQKLKQFLEEFGYYTNQQKQNQINQIMSKITLGLTAESENSQKQQSLTQQNKNILDEGFNRQSLGQQSDYKSCLSRLSLNISEIGELDQQLIRETFNDQNTENSNGLKENQIKKLQQEVIYEDKEQIKNKHLEILNREVEFLYQLCKGEDQAEKQISQKIVNDILCPKFGKRPLQEAIKQAIKKSKSIRVSRDNKDQKGDYLDDKSILDQIILEKEEEESINNKSSEVINSTVFNDKKSKASINQITSANLKRKAPTRRNTRNRTQSTKGQITDTSFSSSASLCESDQEQICSQNDNTETNNNISKEDNKNMKKKQTKKLKK